MPVDGWDFLSMWHEDISPRELRKSYEGKKSGAYSRGKTAHERNTNTIELLQKKQEQEKFL